MNAKVILFFCWWIGLGYNHDVTLEPDIPSKQVDVSKTVELDCCYSIKGKQVEPTWIRTIRAGNHVNLNNSVALSKRIVAKKGSGNCYTLELSNVTTDDAGFYRCLVNDSSLSSKVYTHGTLLLVYKPIRKSLNLSESTKNKMLILEGIFLLLFVIVPGTILLRKKKRHHQLEKVKFKKEEENIYEGLNIEECGSAYHQIQRSQVQGPYQDVDNVKELDIQLEKP